MNAPPTIRMSWPGGERTFQAGQTARIGREADNDVVLTDPNVSRHHGELRFGPSGWEFFDLQSSQGSFVDGRRINAFPIKGGVQVTLGVPGRGIVIDLVTAADDATAVTPASGPAGATALAGPGAAAAAPVAPFPSGPGGPGGPGGPPPGAARPGGPGGPGGPPPGGMGGPPPGGARPGGPGGPPPGGMGGPPPGGARPGGPGGPPPGGMGGPPPGGARPGGPGGPPPGGSPAGPPAGGMGGPGGASGPGGPPPAAPNRPGGALRPEALQGATVVTGDNLLVEAAGTTHTFTRGTRVSLGRDPSNDIAVGNPTASRQHARIFHDGEHWVIEDVGSSSGTFVNGARISGPHRLSGSTVVMLGDPDAGERIVVVTGGPQKPPRANA